MLMTTRSGGIPNTFAVVKLITLPFNIYVYMYKLNCVIIGIININNSRAQGICEELAHQYTYEIPA